MKKIWLLTTLLIGSLLLTGCNKTTVENPAIIDDCVTVDWEDSCAVDIDEPAVEEPEFTWYYFIAETPASNPVSTSFSISDPWNTPLRTWMILNMPITGFNNWDIVKVYYWRDYEELEKFTDFHIFILQEEHQNRIRQK